MLIDIIHIYVAPCLNRRDLVTLMACSKDLYSMLQDAKLWTRLLAVDFKYSIGNSMIVYRIHHAYQQTIVQLAVYIHKTYRGLHQYITPPKEITPMAIHHILMTAIINSSEKKTYMLEDSFEDTNDRKLFPQEFYSDVDAVRQYIDSPLYTYDMRLFFKLDRTVHADSYIFCKLLKKFGHALQFNTTSTLLRDRFLEFHTDNLTAACLMINVNPTVIDRISEDVKNNIQFLKVLFKHAKITHDIAHAIDKYLTLKKFITIFDKFDLTFKETLYSHLTRNINLITIMNKALLTMENTPLKSKRYDKYNLPNINERLLLFIVEQIVSKSTREHLMNSFNVSDKFKDAYNALSVCKYN